MPTDSLLTLSIDPAGLRQLVRAIVAETLAELGTGGGDGRLAYSEPEAAAMLGLSAAQLAGERRRGRITHAVGGKGRILYSRGDLDDYLASTRK